MKVTPKAPRDAIRGWLGQTLRISVRAAPERGRANQAVEALLAVALDVAKSRVRVVAGQASARKQVEIEGLDGAQLRSRLGTDAPAQPV